MWAGQTEQSQEVGAGLIRVTGDSVRLLVLCGIK